MFNVTVYEGNEFIYCVARVNGTDAWNVSRHTNDTAQFPREHAERIVKRLKESFPKHYTIAMTEVV